ncbi:MAG TPA: PLP-dependent aminotransferase family protein, partial [Synergistaceae bacterium]|nr:PLP-dependent aminotransferase family protein [Synergistaceae bacterium]
MPLPTAALPREDVTLLPSPLIEFIRLGLEHSAIPLTSGQPHPSCYPLTELATAASEAIRGEGERHLRYGANRGLGKLRALVNKELINRSLFPPDLSPDSLVLTVGAQGAFDLLCQAVLRPGEA